MPCTRVCIELVACDTFRTNSRKVQRQRPNLARLRLNLDALMLRGIRHAWALQHPQPDSRTWNCFRSSQADAVLPVPRKFRVQGPGRSLKNLKKVNCIAAERPFAAQAKIKDVIVLVLPVPHSNKWLDTAAYCMSSCSYCITLYNRLYNLPHRLRLLDGKLNIILKKMLISSKPI